VQMEVSMSTATEITEPEVYLSSGNGGPRRKTRGRYLPATWARAGIEHFGNQEIKMILRQIVGGAL
jgi:hypothetical protein